MSCLSVAGRRWVIRFFSGVLIVTDIELLRKSFEFCSLGGGVTARIEQKKVEGYRIY